METRIFSHWISTFRSSINGYGYYTDFKKAYANIEGLKTEISLLGSLVGSKNMERDFRKLICGHPECLKAIPVLLAVREGRVYCQDSNEAVNYEFDRKVQSEEECIFHVAYWPL